MNPDMYKGKNGNNGPPADGGPDIEALKTENERIMGGFHMALKDDLKKLAGGDQDQAGGLVRSVREGG